VPHDGVQAVLVTTGEKIVVGDSLVPEYAYDFSKVLGTETGQFVEVNFSHSPAF